MTRAKKIASCDCETDPFEHGLQIKPFLWGFWDGKEYREFDETGDFVEFVSALPIVLYAHNGGKFDFMFLLKFLRETRAQIINGRFVSLNLGNCELRDSYSIIPEPLKNFGAKQDIEMWKLRAENRAQHMGEIKSYCEQDCKILYDAVKRYREKAGKQKTIASNALTFARKLGLDPGKTNHRFDEDFRPFYFGGRTECFQPGTHRNIRLIDIHSAYPYAMSHNHATGHDFTWKSDFTGMSEEEMQCSFVTLECMSRGAFPKRTNDGLAFPHAYDRYHVTGWEFLTALQLGLIEDLKIETVRTTDARITFKPYVDHWYAEKKAVDKKTDPTGYTIAKIMLNSLYGKLAQNPARYKDYRIVPAGTRINPVVLKEVTLKSGRKKWIKSICEFVRNKSISEVCEVCGEHANEHGWTLEFEYEGHEIHARESLWKWKFELGEEWKAKPLYKNVATGASITGFTRAHLLRAMAAIGWNHVLYVDTDGIACGPGADLSKIPFNDELGSWELEEEGAPIGHFCGKKLYGIELSKPKKGNKYKVASKGTRLTFQDIEKVARGETVRWESPSPTFKLDGSQSYIVRDIKRTDLRS